MARRVRLLELALERLRWLPVPADGPVIVVNLAAFRLWAFDRAGGVSRPGPSMKVVVGRALRSQTPVLGEELRYLIFRPYWNIPPSIARNETVPAARRDPGYLAANDMEIVAADRDDSPVFPATPDNLARVGAGGLRIRQRPGPKNSLGRIKFIFPNNANVYLHDTPARGLFALERRDLSHGCVRVAEPVALAEWALRGVPGWTRERIEKAMSEGPPQQVNLPAPIPVILFYATAAVDARGQAAFFEDIYGHDRRLDERLGAQSETRR
jgi:murein L,D-transpeptidase YcbB/YkuD